MRALDLFGRLALAKWSVMYLALFAAAAFGVASAYACPPGTVFSAFNGRGICALIGQGARVGNVCFITRTGGCPAGFDFEHKNSDPTRSYCCPRGARRSECRHLQAAV